MKSAMVIYFSPLFKLMSNTMLYKNGITIGTATIMSIVTEFFIKITSGSFLGVSSGFLLLISFMFLIDFILGLCASSHEYKRAKAKGDKEGMKLKKFQSHKLTFTFFKFIMLFIWIWLVHGIYETVSKISWIEPIYNTIAFVPLILVTLREYVSMGENIERIYKTKPYIFTLADSIFEALQFKFIKKLKGDK